MSVRAIFGFLTASVLIASCYGPGREPPAEPARLRVRAVPENALVRIDDETVIDGRAIAVSPAELAPGHHLLSIEADGYFPHDMELDLASGETTVDIRLRPLPP